VKKISGSMVVRESASRSWSPGKTRPARKAREGCVPCRKKRALEAVTRMSDDELLKIRPDLKGYL